MTDELKSAASRFCDKAGLSLHAQVGEGAFKLTFLVTDSTNNPFALKVFKPGARSERSVREINALQTCNHPGIAKLLSIAETVSDGDKYLVQLEEFCAGRTLQEKVISSRDELIEIAIKLNAALAHIAGLGLVHRDIKPENLMFRDEAKRTPVIVDFGLVRNLHDTSITPTWADRGPGTPFFAPPEQLNNEKALIDWRSDQFSLGITLAYCYFKTHPYASRGEEPAITVGKVSARCIPDAEFRTAAERDNLRPLVRMVAPWPVQRYRTPELLAGEWNKLGES